MGILGRCQRARQQRAKFKEYAIDEVPKGDFPYALSKGERAAVDSKWGELRYSPSYRWHEVFASIHGFDEHYVPADSWFMYLMPKLNDRKLIQAWSDKSYLPKIFEGLPVPESYGFCIKGRFYDANYQSISEEKLIGTLRNKASRAIVKPSGKTWRGHGVAVVEPETLDPVSLRKLASDRMGNCIFQAVIEQSQTLSMFNSNSCNIVRVYTLRLGNEIHVLSATVRFGVGDSITDVSYDENGELQYRTVGVTADGRFKENIYDALLQARPFDVAEMSPGDALPGYNRVVEACRLAHSRMHHFDLIGFDMCIDKNNEPLIIEANKEPGLPFNQAVNGPAFGDMTDDVIAYCKKK